MDIRGRFDWQSISVTGLVHAIEAETETYQQFLDTVADNG